MRHTIITGKTWTPPVYVGCRHFQETRSWVPVDSREATAERCSFIQPLALPLPSSVLFGMLFILLNLGFLSHSIELITPMSQDYVQI